MFIRLDQWNSKASMKNLFEMSVSKNVLRPKCNYTVNCMSYLHVSCLSREVLMVLCLHWLQDQNVCRELTQSSSHLPNSCLTIFPLSTQCILFLCNSFPACNSQKIPQTFKMLFFTIKRTNRFTKLVLVTSGHIQVK